MIPYEGQRITGPYICKDGRVRIAINGNVMSYPKYLMEIELGRYLDDNEQVHHRDENPLNNDISNLEVLNRVDHGKQHKKHKVDIEVECYLCKRIFILTAQKQRQRDKNKYRNDKGPFCSRVCSGKYGKLVQLGRVAK
jgi:hypothetical protein